MEDYRINFWHEAVSDSFDQADLYSIWETIPKEKQQEISKTLAGWQESASMNFGFVDTRAEDPEISRLKARIKELEKEASEWQQSFAKNVAMRRNTEVSFVSVNKDGTADYHY